MISLISSPPIPQMAKDSRNPEIGDIDRRQIVGKVIMLLMPGNDGGNLQREYDRIGVID